MKAEEYLKVKSKMRDDLSYYVSRYESTDPKRAIKLVENYKKANPDMTNAQKFEMIFGFPPDHPVKKEWWNDLYVPRELVLS